jgi:predicted nucleotidyltransferase
MELQDLLGVKVDLVTLGDIPYKFRAFVLQQAMPL